MVVLSEFTVKDKHHEFRQLDPVFKPVIVEILITQNDEVIERLEFTDFQEALDQFAQMFQGNK